MKGITVLRAGQAEVVETDWGRLTWLASGRLGNSAEVTVGQCLIRPGKASPRHSHPNCEEVLYVLAGRIAHTADGGREAELSINDVVSVPPNVAHNARNIGAQDAVLAISFSSPERQTRGED
jgi:quercetin dioxygenase-like cupin family protein